MKTYTLFILCCLIVNVSCIKEPEPTKLSKTNVNVTFKAQLSGASQAMSKALTPAQENAVKDIEILAFEKSGTDYLFSYRISGTQIIPVAGGIEFTANLKPYDSEQIFLIVANAKASIDAVTIPNDAPINNVLSLLIFTQDAEFATINGDLFIPMYVKTPSIHITNSTTHIGTYNLIRMLARIDISSSTATDFKLARAAIYNRKNKGYIPYKDALWNASQEKATVAYVPNAVGTTKSPSSTYLAENNIISHSIYTFEAQGVMDPINATTIVVGGYYKPTTNTTVLTYYRIDIPQFVGTVAQLGTCGDILRNHLYQITIQSAKEAGATTPDAAFDNAKKPLNTTITVWNQNKMDVNIDKPKSIQIDTSTFKYDGVNTKTRKLTFTTDDATWTASTDQTWLKVGTHTSDGNKYQLTYTIDPFASGADRTGHINIKVGTLVKKVLITQYAGPAITYIPQAYFLTEDTEYDLTIKSKAPWTISVLDNPNNVIEEFDTKPGVANNITGDTRTVVLNYQEEGVFDASVRIASVNGEFDPYIIPIQAVSAYDFDDFYVYPVDQLSSQPWYVYANTPDNYNTTNVPPRAGTQMNPPRENSCACIKSSVAGKPWRLPTNEELLAIYEKVKLQKISDVVPYYAANPFYNITHEFNTRCWYLSAESSITSHAKCVGFTAYPYNKANPNVAFSLLKLIPHTGSSKKTGSRQPGDFAFPDEIEGARCVRDK